MPKSHLISVDAVSNRKGPGIGIGIVIATEGMQTAAATGGMTGAPIGGMTGDIRRMGLLTGILKALSCILDRFSDGDRLTIMTVLDKDALLAPSEDDPDFSRALQLAIEGFEMFKQKGLEVDVMQGEGQEMPMMKKALELATIELLKLQRQH